MFKIITHTASALVLFAATLAFSQSNGDFTIVALPDTQFYSKTYPQIFEAETKWIADHASALNIKLVLGLGDIVDGGGEAGQWQNADAAIRNLERKVPYMLAIGNHDYDRNNPGGRTASATNYNAFFGPQRFRDRAWYKGSYPAGSNENFYGTFTFGGKPFLVIVLECFPRDSALAWAASIIQAHPGSDTIIVTHAYTYFDNTRLDHCDSNSAASMGAGNDNDGEQVWEKLASKYPNIVLVLSGHVVQGDGTGRRADLGASGNLVNQILSDYQSYANGGNGYIRLVTIRPAANQVQIRTYSPYLDAYLTDSHNQFTVPYKNTGISSTPVTLGGIVKNAADCSAMEGIPIATSSGSTVTDATGHYSIAAGGPRGYTATINRTGFVVPYNKVGLSAIPGQPSPGKVFLSAAGLLRGVVVRNGGTVPGARVGLSGGALRVSSSVTTGADGSFSAGWMPIGNYTLTVTLAGQRVLTSRVTVKAGATNEFSITVPK